MFDYAKQDFYLFLTWYSDGVASDKLSDLLRQKAIKLIALQHLRKSWIYIGVPFERFLLSDGMFDSDLGSIK